MVIHVQGSQITSHMVSASLGGHLTPFLTQIPVQLATVQGKRLTASGQAQESNHTGRGVGHDEEMNQQKCPQVPTAPGYSQSHTMPAALPRVCLACQEQTATTRGVNGPKVSQIWCPRAPWPSPRSRKCNSTLLRAGLKAPRGQGPVFCASAQLLFNRLSNADQLQTLH